MPENSSYVSTLTARYWPVNELGVRYIATPVVRRCTPGYHS